MMEPLLLWFIAIIAVISLIFGFILGRFIPNQRTASLAILISPFLILLAVAGALGSMIVVETWRRLAEGRLIDGEALGIFAVAYLVATCPAVVGGLFGRVMRRG
jgi:hypothetical protein